MLQFESQNGVEAKGIGVVGTWYIWDDIGVITKTENLKEDFVSIEIYRTTVRNFEEVIILIVVKNEVDKK